MLNFMHLLKLEQLEAEKGGGGGGNPAAPAAAKPPVSDNTPAGDDAFDELGYAKEPAAAAAPASTGKKDEGGEAGKKPESQAAADDKASNASGYGEEPADVEPPKADPPPAGEEIDLGYELKTEGLSPEEAKNLKGLLKDLGATKEQAEKLLATRKSELKAAEESRKKAEEAMKQEQAETRKRWHNELKNDPNFGGEKFAFNVKRAEKVIEEFMPDTKKVLTERKSMLPPYVMRDLLRLGNHLFATESLKQGDPPAPPAPEEQDDALAFYN